MISETEFYFTRHGQTDWNLERRAQGQIDVPLNDEGRRQAAALAQATSDLKFGTICASPLSRALDTANAVAGVTGSPVTVLDNLAECCWGDREGDERGVWFEQWKRGIDTPRGAERYEQFIERATQAINEALTHPGPVLIVAHGGIYWAVQTHATRNLDYSLPNARLIKHMPPRDAYPWWETHEI